MASAWSGLINALRDGGPRRAAALTGRRLFLSWLAGRKELIIVQVGAYIGVTGNDPLYRFFRTYFDPARDSFRPDWRAVLVEPVPQYFGALRENYKGLVNIAYEQAAITAADGPVIIRTLSCDPAAHGIPDWASQLSSIVSDPASWPGLPKNIREHWRTYGRDEVVPGLALGSLMSRHR